MNWPYKHGANQTCTSGCRMFGTCHCGCGAKAPISNQNKRPFGIIKGNPRSFLPHHYKHVQWRPTRSMATCHPDRINHRGGLCSRCDWQKWKRAARRWDANPVDDWERSRYTTFMALLSDGLEIPEAIRQLDKEVPEEAMADG